MSMTAEQNTNLIFFDIDGTLITDDERRLFPEDAKAAIAAARKKGSLCFINTGRVRCNVEPFITEPGFDGLVCGCGTYIEYRGEILHHREMEPERCREIAHVCRKCRIQSFFEYSDFASVDGRLDMPYIRPLAEYFAGCGRPLPDDIDADTFRFDKFSGWYDDSSDLAAFRQEVEKDFTYIDRGAGFFELEPIGYSKASGIEFLLKHFHIPRERVYCFGDGNNDLEMMAYAGHAVAMGNGNENCRAAAEYVTSAVEEGGILRALEYFRLI